MKIYVFIAFMAIFAITSAVFVPPKPGHKKALLGARECTWGPSYWCQNLTSAAGCNAVTHCIQTVWIHKQLPPDTTSVCQTCLDMVKQARDQLMSNDTQELIKQVFEGSCSLLHIKPVVKECNKIADEFIPELIDTLASEMNPQVVCSVAGLCNNEKIHRMIKEAGESVTEVVKRPGTCEGCHTVVGLVESKFNKMSRDEVLQSILEVCGKLGSLSDGCSNIIITYFNEIYAHLQDNLHPNDICLMAGECSAQFHQHANVEIIPLSHIGYVPVDSKDDLPCELCEQLVNHLRDLLVANTTENEFKLVLTGLCKQTKQFSSECLSIVDEYYPVIYNFLIEELNSTAACTMIGICKKSDQLEGPIVPLLPAETAESALSITPASNKPLIHVGLTKGTSSVKVMPPVEEQQLPIDLLMPPHTQVLYNNEICVFCEYFLHYLQEAITDPKTEENIKEEIDRACDILPVSINNTCHEFVDTYEPALIAILAQEIDPSQVCPLLKACPSSENRDVEIFMRAKSSGKCPLCLYAVTQVEQMVKNKKTEDNIKNALNELCVHLSNSLKEECEDFVSTYTNELVELLIADLKPEEVCVYLKLCTDDRPASTLPPYVDNNIYGGNVETNIIPDNTVDGKPLEDHEKLKSGPQCVLCEFVMKEIEDQLKDKKTDADIKNIVYSICNVMPGSIRSDCDKFVDQYAETIIQLLIEVLEPSEICSMMKLCTNQIETLKDEILECPVCQLTVEAMEKILSNPKVDHDIMHVLEKTCRGLPTRYKSKCKNLIENYGREIFMLILHLKNPHKICREILLCVDTGKGILVGTRRCTYGPSYWCISEKTADECGARKHCETKVWQPNSQNQTGISRRNSQLLGEKHCTRGPGYWCQSEVTADECGAAARLHCETKIWGKTSPRRNSKNLLGAKPCTRGPGYWCQSESTADECGAGARQHCETKVWGKTRSRRSPFGEKNCSRGPGYWCQSQTTADECGSGAREHCETKVWGKTRSRRSPFGEENCSRGPGYWCQSQTTADECGSGAREHCEKNVWGKTRLRRETKLLGTKPCTSGPGYWCQSESTADECGAGARAHCESKVWGSSRPKREETFVGGNPCVRGPSYWCQSESTANKCGLEAREHCEKKVWNVAH